jgi:dimethylamine--corrinoid protein Co-methyltransferase
VGDPFGMHIAHIVASGMGGIRTAGDLVAWMQITAKMKITEAKQYVADKLGIEIIDLTNEEIMRQIRTERGIGVITSIAGDPKGMRATSIAGDPKGMRAKFKISQLLNIQINSVDLFKSEMT